MTAPSDDAAPDLQAMNAQLRVERDSALAEKEALEAERRALVVELAAGRDAYRERISHEAATIKVLKVMSASLGDPQPVFDLICHEVRKALDAENVALFEYNGKLVHHRADSSTPTVAGATYAAYKNLFPMRPTRESLTCRAILDNEVVYVQDVAAQSDLLSTIYSLGHKSQVLVPFTRNGCAIGAISVTSWGEGGFSDSQIELLKTFAEQAVIAITTAETYRLLQDRKADLQESREYQVAVGDVMKIIRNFSYDLTSMFQIVVDTAVRVCRADQAAIYRFQDGAFRLVASQGLSPEYEAIEQKVAIKPGVGTLVGRVAMQCSAVQILDVWTDPLYDEKHDARIGGVRTMLGVPLLRGGVAVGVIGLGRRRFEPYIQRQVDLVQTFADQVIIAMENARLLTEQREALEQETATAEVLAVIN